MVIGVIRVMRVIKIIGINKTMSRHSSQPPYLAVCTSPSNSYSHPPLLLLLLLLYY